MDYVREFYIIAKALLVFEKRSCSFYRKLCDKLSFGTTNGLVERFIREKTREVDTFSGMVTVSSFLLKDRTISFFDPAEIAVWLKLNIPHVYCNLSAERILSAQDPRAAITVMVELERAVLLFYRALRKRVPMNTAQIESIICRQKQRIALLTDTREKLPDKIDSGELTVTSIPEPDEIYAS